MSDVAVACRGVSKRFGAVTALDAVSLDVRQGEIMALLGPSGCGKTTFLRVVAGFERADRGEVDLAGRLVDAAGTFVPPERRRAPLVFQDYALFPHMTVAQNIAYGLPRGARRKAGDLARLVGLDGLERRYPHQLSGGQQQRVALARALAPEPAIVLLDEPFSNLDADLRARVRGEIRAILRAAGATAVFVTHDQNEAFDIADRIAVMRAGRIEQVGRSEEVYHVPRTRFVADFVGRADFLPAMVRAGRIDTELGAFAFEAVALDDGPAEVMVRPEDVVLGDHGPTTGRIEDVRFQGPVTLASVRLPSGATVAALHPSPASVAPGERVGVTFEPEHVVVFRGDDRVAWMTTRS